MAGEVLILHSYEHGSTWTKGVDTGVRAALGDSKRLRITSEFLDAKRKPLAEYEGEFVRYLRAKYAHQAPVLVVVSDNAAFDLIQRYQPRLFPQTPIVFCGVNNFTPELIKVPAWTTGVVEQTDARRCFEFMQSLLPHMRRCIVISDATVTGQAELKHTQAKLGERFNGVEIKYWDNIAHTEIRALLQTLDPAHDAVLLLMYNRDSTGNYYTYEEAATRLAADSPVPIFSMWDFYLNTGVVGGDMISAFDQGRVAGELALRLLLGAAVADVPVVLESPNRYMLDVAAAARFDLPTDHLSPETHTINNQIHPLWQYRREIAATLTLIVLQGILIMVLVWRSGRRHRQLIAELVASKKGFDELAEQSRTVHWELDVDGRFTKVSHIAETVYGYTPEEMVGKKFFYDLYPDDTRHSMLRLMNINCRELIRFSNTHRTILTRNGMPVRVSTNVMPIHDLDGHLIGYRGGDTDISELHKAREETLRLLKGSESARRSLEQLNRRLEEESQRANFLAEKAAQANASKSQFLANMSHEIRTPMTAILGYTEALQDYCSGTGEPDRAEIKNLLETISRNGEHLLTLINDILDLSKVEAGKLTVESIRFSPVELLYEVDSLLSYRAREKGLKLEIRFEGGISETIQSDPTRLRQILINITGNAIKFTEQGQVSITARLVAPDSEQPSIEFDVADSGPGMTPAQIKNLFQPFVQADSSTTRQFGGTGLGLTISKRLAKALQGDVVLLKSEPGKGSCFRVRVGTGPLDDVELLADPRRSTTSLHAATSEEEHAIDFAGRRFLVAEDGPDNQRLIKYILEKFGAQVTLVDNGLDAIAAIYGADQQGVVDNANAPFDAVLMDMQMPVMDGYTTTAKLRQRGYRGAIIALTANAMSSDRQKCLQVGCDEYETKPIRRKQLLAKLFSLIENANPSAA